MRGDKVSEASHDDLQRSLGRVEGNQGAMGERLDRFEKLVSDGFRDINNGLDGIRVRLGQIENKESERKGAWRVVAGVATVVSALVSALVGWLVKLVV